MFNILWDRSIETQFDQIKKMYSLWKKKNANTISKIDDYVKHIFGKHHQEVNHWANLVVEGQRKIIGKIIVDRDGNTETWKAVKGFWDVNSKDSGKSGCGVVIKGVDKDRWVESVALENWYGYDSRSCSRVRAHGNS